MPAIKIYIVIILISTLLACNNKINYPEGGYAYPEHVDDKDTNFYYYPLKDKLSRKDSFMIANSYFFFNGFNEPNLSIKPQESDIFRFMYSGFHVDPVVITLKEKEIIIKKGDRDGYYEYPSDENKLTDIEKIHYNILERRFPLEQPQKQKVKRYIDSLVKLYPQLLDVNYYQYLLNKTLVPNDSPFRYTLKRISIDFKTYKNLVDLINNSGFWNKPDKIECEHDWTDGDGFTFEVSTKNKYNIYRGYSCPNDHGKFLTALEALIKVAQMEKEIGMIWSDETTSVIPDSLIIQDIELADVKSDSTNVATEKKK